MLGRPFRQFRLKGLLTTMNELNEAKRVLARMLLSSKEIELSKLLEGVGNSEVVDEAYDIIFSSVFPTACEILDDGPMRPTMALLKCQAMGMGVGESMSMIRSGVHSDDPLFTVEDRGIGLTPNGRKNTIRAVRAVKRFTLTEKVEVPGDVNEVLDSVLKKTELELV